MRKHVCIYGRRCWCGASVDGECGRGTTSSCWPMKSLAMGVHTSQIKEAMERNKKAGVTGVTYDPKTGDAILSDRGARRDLMRVHGFHDRNGGYGDDHPPTEFTDSGDDCGDDS